MPGFKIYRNNSASSERYPFLVDVQSELLSSLETRLAIPLVLQAVMAGAGIRNLNPTTEINQAVYLVLTQQMASVPKRVLGEEMEGLSVDRNQILSSIDFLTTGI
jgi:toxin CcdB